LSFAQFSVLNQFVRLGGERSLVEMARSFQVTKPAMTKLVRKLEEAGHVSVRPNPADSRSKLVSITERGVSARHQAIMALAPSFGEMRRAIGDEAFEQALPFLTALREWLERNG
jgi:DNA-binding MarR family transcriptional regulator